MNASTCPSPDGPPELRADCIADSAGGLTFDVTAPSREADAVWSAALVLRLRGGDGEADEVRLPLGPTCSGRLRAVLPSTVALAEGRWNAYADLGDGQEARPLLPGVNDLRSLVDRRPLAGIGRLGVRIPYATRHGSLALRSWLRGPHAEAGELSLSPEGVTVRGRLYGAALAPGAIAEARSRGAVSPLGGGDAADGMDRAPSRADTPSRTATAPGAGTSGPTGPGVAVTTTAAPVIAAPATGVPVITVPLTGEGPDFTFTLPYEPLAGHWTGGTERWDLWVRAAEDAEPARIARLLEDAPDRKQTVTYPALPVATRTARVRIGPYYTLDNDLAIRVAGRTGPEAD
ncbi:hypothetical protein [Streptomyces sp. MST-110588]|uniref:hypothetical protein n=1 Tax=Streptomyces sp. MST-110588 TaxID=2833628 RepID=UPI001F5C59FC|nr:hypothetical protein [Streptomyces sp. MST-110588]